MEPRAQEPQDPEDRHLCDLLGGDHSPLVPRARVTCPTSACIHRAFRGSAIPSLGHGLTTMAREGWLLSVSENTALAREAGYAKGRLYELLKMGRKHGFDSCKRLPHAPSHLFFAYLARMSTAKPVIHWSFCRNGLSDCHQNPSECLALRSHRMGFSIRSSLGPYPRIVSR